jgi:hypothetical protein
MSVKERVRILDMQAATGVAVGDNVEEGVMLDVRLEEKDGRAPKAAISVVFSMRVNNRRSSIAPPQDSHTSQIRYPQQCDDTAK